MIEKLNENSEENIKKLADLIKGIRVAMMTTVEPDGSLHSRPMATQDVEFDGELWFFSEKHSGKSAALGSNSNVNLAYSEPGDNRYVSLAGTAEVVLDKQKAKELWSPALKAWFPKGLDDSELSLIRVKVESAEYWDAPSSTLVKIVGFTKAVATGQRYEPGENRRLDINTH